MTMNSSQDSLAAKESVSNICTLLIIGDDGFGNSFSSTSIERMTGRLGGMVGEAQATLDGDWIVLILRAFALTLENYGELLCKALERSADGRDSGGSPTRRSSRSQKNATLQQTTIALMEALPLLFHVGTSTPVHTLHFHDSMPKDFIEETLRVLSIANRLVPLRPFLSTSHSQLMFCASHTEPSFMLPALRHATVVLRLLGKPSSRSLSSSEGPTAGESLTPELQGAVTKLATNVFERILLNQTQSVAFNWDEAFTEWCGLISVLTIAWPAYGCGASKGNRVASPEARAMFFALCEEAVVREVAPARLRLIFAATFALAGVEVADYPACQLWLRQAVEMAIEGEAAYGDDRGIPNPFEAERSLEDMDLLDDVAMTIDSLAWRLEDFTVTALCMFAQLTGLPLEINEKYLWAWRDDQQTYHPYSGSICAKLTTQYFLPGVPSTTVSSENGSYDVRFGELLQISRSTGRSRLVHFQCIPRKLVLRHSIQKNEYSSAFNSSWSWSYPRESGEGTLFVGLTAVEVISFLRKLDRLMSSRHPMKVHIARLLKVHLICSYPGILDIPEAHDLVLRSLHHVAVVDPVAFCGVALSLVSINSKWATLIVQSGMLDSLSQACGFSQQQSFSRKRLRGDIRQRVATVVEETKKVVKRLVKVVRETSELASAKGDGEGSLLASSHREKLLTTLEDLTTEEQREALLRSLSRGEVSGADAVSALIQAVANKGSRLLPKRNKNLTQELCNHIVEVFLCSAEGSNAGVLTCKEHKRPLILHHSAAWTCNECFQHFETASWSCRECNYDLCQHCANDKNPSRMEVARVATIADIYRHLRTASSRLEGRTLIQRLLHTLTEGRLGLRAEPAPPSDGNAANNAMPSPSLMWWDMKDGSMMKIPASWTVDQLDRFLRAHGNHMHLFSRHDAVSCACGSCHRDGNHRLTAASDEETAIHQNHHHHCPRSPQLVVYDPDVAQLIHWEAIGRACLDLGVPFTPTDRLDDILRSTLKLAAPDIFLKGLRGLPLGVQRLLTSPVLQQGIHLTTRTEAAYFIGVSCRRYALRYMNTEDMVTKGAVAVGTSGMSDEAQILPTKVKVPRLTDKSATQWNALMELLDRVYGDLPRIDTKLEYNFVGEEGTGEGPTQEFYSELSRNFYAQPHLWSTVEEDVVVNLPSTKNYVPRDMRVLGYATARAFVDNYRMSTSFDPLFWQVLVQLQSERFNLNSTNSRLPALVTSWVNKPYYKMLVGLRTMEAEELDALCLSMEEDDTPVTPSNVDAFVEGKFQAFARILTGNMLHFLEAFGEVLDPEILQLFQPAEAARVFGGSFAPDQPLFTFDELRQAVCGGHGYTTESEIVKQFVSVVSQFSPEDQSYLLEFITGSPRPPVGGLRCLGRPIMVVRKNLEGSGEGTLPSCSTCFLYVKLPPYSSEEIMKERLLTAIREGRRNFSLS